MVLPNLFWTQFLGTWAPSFHSWLCLSAPSTTLREPPSWQKVSPQPSAHTNSPLTQASWVPGQQGSQGPSQLTGHSQGFMVLPLPVQDHTAQASGHLFQLHSKQLCLQGSLGDVWRHFVTLWGNAVGIQWVKGRTAAISTLQGTFDGPPPRAPSISCACLRRSPGTRTGFKSFCIQVIEPKIYVCNPNHLSNLYEHCPLAVRIWISK